MRTSLAYRQHPMTAEYTLKRVAETEGGGLRGFVERVGEPLTSAEVHPA
jgi:hypothetical protein